MFHRERFRPCPDSWRLVPTPVLFQCSYAAADYRDNCFAAEGIARPKQLNRAWQGRRAEYLAGRYAAKRVLERLGYPSSVQVDSDPDRVPRWPGPVRGSISHTASEAICAAFVGTRPGQSLGVDIERCLAPGAGAGLRSQVLTGNERRLISGGPLREPWALTLLFSAKESLFKAIYPLTRQAFDFRAAEVVQLNPEQKTFTVRLRRSVGERFPIGWRISGRYLLDAGHVVTLILL